jgi:hypothetical protein
METLSVPSTSEDTLTTHWSARALAFYLPQFHPIPENNAWWGPGFTEWTNTAKARPLFRSHKQPHLPADLGFYDLRLAETRQAQAELARTYGVEAFVYWHYWFAGRRILERPFEEMLHSGEPEQGFCLAWANQSWTGAWHGAHDRILIEQTYPGPQDEEAHFEYLLPAFQDARYFRVNGVPLFYIFRPEQLPDAQAFARRWREMAVAAGLGGLYLVAEISDLLGKGPISGPPESYGFDAGVYMRLPAQITPWARWRMRFCRKMLRWPETYDCLETPPATPESYRADNIHPCLYSNWDNTPRAGRRGLVLRGTSPAVFRAHVSTAAHRLQARPWQERLLFLKSWNEWAEGNYLEPDMEYGHGFLQALAAGLTS